MGDSQLPYNSCSNAVESKQGPSERETRRPTSSVDVYQYNALPTNRSIRLLELWPRQDTKSVAFALRTFEFNSAPPYEAISYVWGDSSIQVHVLCEGKSAKITPNLKAALQHLQMENTTRLLWADAVCINQEDLEERSQQVRIMSSVFSMAQRVLIWMPPPIDGDIQAISLIKKIVGLFCEENSISIERLGQVDNFDALREFKVEKLRLIVPAEWKSFFNFYDHTYFTRTWCIREVSASQNALVLYGQTEIDFNIVALAASWFSYDSEKFEAIRHMSSDRGIAHAGFMRRKNLLSLSLRNLLDQTTSFDCSDPRDKIYATLDFALDGRATWIKPDYTKTELQVYLEATMQMINEDGLMFLSHVFHDDTIRDDWPSWVPLWTCWTFMPLSRPRMYKASGTTDVFTYEQAGSNLALRGFRIDTVTTVHDRLLWSYFDFSDNSDEKGSLLEVWAEYATGEKSSTVYPTGEKFSIAFSKTMTAGFSCNEASFDAYTRHLLTKTPGTSSGPVSENDGDADPRAYQLLVQQCTCNRRLFLTQNGYLGIGPKALQSDDQIWILFGARTPIALRPNGDYYQVAGDCYVHGYMNGEGVQGLDAGKFVDEDVVLC